MPPKWVEEPPTAVHPVRGVLKVEKTPLVVINGSQKLINIRLYGYCGYGEVDCDPKMGGDCNNFFEHPGNKKCIILKLVYGYPE